MTPCPSCPSKESWTSGMSLRVSASDRKAKELVRPSLQLTIYFAGLPNYSSGSVTAGIVRYYHLQNPEGPKGRRDTLSEKAQFQAQKRETQWCSAIRGMQSTKATLKMQLSMVIREVPCRMGMPEMNHYRDPRNEATPGSVRHQGMPAMRYFPVSKERSSRSQGTQGN